VLQVAVGWSWLSPLLLGKARGGWGSAGEPGGAQGFVGVLHPGSFAPGFALGWVQNWQPSGSCLPCQQVVRLAVPGSASPPALQVDSHLPGKYSL